MQKQNPLISVIIPVYNAGNFLEYTLEAIKNQTFKNFEVICVNDGSTDNSQEILEKYAAKDKNFRIFYQNNQGGSASRNFALDKVKGQYIAFCDHDDIYHPQYLEVLYRHMCDTGADISCCSYLKFALRGGYNFKERYTAPFPVRFMSESPFEDKFCHKKKIGTLMWQKLYAAPLLEGIRFSLKLPAINDILFNIEVLLNSRKAVVCTQELIAYRQGETSQTLQKLSEKRIQEYRDLFSEIVNLGEKYPGRQKVLDKIATRYAYGMFVDEVLHRYNPLTETELYDTLRRYLQEVLSERHFRFFSLGIKRMFWLWAFCRKKNSLLHRGYSHFNKKERCQ